MNVRSSGALQLRLVTEVIKSTAAASIAGFLFASRGVHDWSEGVYNTAVDYF